MSRDSLIVDLHDGRTVSVPLSWYPRLAYGSAKERQQWELIGPGIGIHWPALDEDISIEGLLKGMPSGESPDSFSRWLSSKRLTAGQRVSRVKARSGSGSTRNARLHARGRSATR
jgi:hypothetical protein